MKNNMNIDKLNAFPHVDECASGTKWNKSKYPYRVTDEDAISKYEKEGHEVVALTDIKERYRFNTGRIYLERPNREPYTNMITLSKPSAECVCVRKVGEQVQVCLTMQPRTPYVAEVNGKKYARFFIEQPAGLVESYEFFEEAAKREVREETGYEVKDLQRLISPMICRHVSYSDETSIVFLANIGEFKGQELDENEDIKTKWYNLEELENEFEDYLDGRKEHFFNFDIPDLTILSLQRFFVKYHRGEISF